MRPGRPNRLIPLLGLVLLALPAAALERGQVLEVSQAAIGRTLGEHTLLDRQGQPFALSRLAGQPLLISVVYSGCVHSCNIATRHLDRAVQVARQSLGRDAFSVVTIGFDHPVDRPETMREFARRYRVDDEHWYFLSADDPAALEALISRLGFSYQPTAYGYDHIAQVTLLDAEQRIRRQIYGESFDLPQLVEPLKDLVWGRPLAEQGMFARLLDRIRLLCTVYDPHRDRYVFDYSLFVGLLVGALIIGLGIFWLVREAVFARSRS
ncbi:MAG: SCO family protein [Wenzhouxiangellaceae bacterium]